MKINFPEQVWAKVMDLTQENNISPVKVLYMAIELLHKQQIKGQANDDSAQESNRTAPTMVK